MSPYAPDGGRVVVNVGRWAVGGAQCVMCDGQWVMGDERWAVGGAREATIDGWRAVLPCSSGWHLVEARQDLERAAPGQTGERGLPVTDYGNEAIGAGSRRGPNLAVAPFGEEGEKEQPQQHQRER